MANTLTSPRSSTNYHNFSALRKTDDIKAIYRNKKSNKSLATAKKLYSQRDVPTFNSTAPPTEMIKSFSTPYIKHLDPTTQQHTTKEARYSTTTLKSATFGHRPSSASRHLDPLTGRVRVAPKNRRRKENNRAGMSATELQDLLHKRKKNTTVKNYKIKFNESLYKVPTEEDSLQKLEKAFDDKLHCPPSAYDSRPMPRMLNEPDPTLSIAAKLQKYQRLASGVTEEPGFFKSSQDPIDI